MRGTADLGLRLGDLAAPTTASRPRELRPNPGIGPARLTAAKQSLAQVARSQSSSGRRPRTELRRRRAEDHCRHPRAAGHREDPHPPGTGPAAAAQGPSARGGARLRCPSRACCRKHVATGCTARPQPGRRCAPSRHDAVSMRLNPDVEPPSTVRTRSVTVDELTTDGNAVVDGPTPRPRTALCAGLGPSPVPASS